MSNRYYSASGRQGISIRLILIIIIPLLVIMLSWLYFNREQDSVDSGSDQVAVQALNIPNQGDTDNKQQDGFAFENGTSGKDNDQPKQEVETGLEARNSLSNSEHQQSNTIILPLLSESDAVFKQDLLGLSSGFFPWLNSKNIIKQWLIAANDFSQNLRPNKHFRQFKLNQPFHVASDNVGMYITKQSYHRYNSLASAVHVVNVESALALYLKYRPLLEQVFAEFAYPEEFQVEDVIKKAASNILQAPILEGKVRVVKPSVYYGFADQKLETLSPVQKQMIRMGPENTRIIQAKLRQFIEGLTNQ